MILFLISMIQRKKDIILTLKISNDITDWSYMFYGCINLKSFPEFENYDRTYLEYDDSQESEQSNEFYPKN